MKFTDLIMQAQNISAKGNKHLHISCNKLSADQSAFNFSDQAISLFETYIEENKFIEKFQNIRNGQLCNLTENRSASHFQYRDHKSNLYKNNIEVLSNIVEQINNNYEQVIFFGIGGSFLGPMLLNDAFSTNGKKVIFVTGSDPNEYMGLIDTCLLYTSPSPRD